MPATSDIPPGELSNLAGAALPTELESKVQTKLEMMLDETEPMKFHEIVHF